MSSMTRASSPLGLCALALFILPSVSSCEPDERCGPSRDTVVRVIDGDTIELSGGQTVRLLMVDTPETTGGATDCYGQEAKQWLTTTLITQRIDLDYDVECEDRYGRLLAYVSLHGTQVNSRLVELGYACVLHIPPNGDQQEAQFEALELLARTQGRGMWGACEEVTCD